MWYLRPCGVPHVGCHVPFQASHARMDTAKATALKGGPLETSKQCDGETSEEPETRLRRSKTLDLEAVLPPEVG